MALTSDSDLHKTLLQKIAEKDEQALDHLHRLFARRIYVFTLNRLHNEAEAEEIVGDTLYEVWQCASRFRGESSVSTWILGIARNKMLTRLRKSQIQTTELDEEMEEAETDVFEPLMEQEQHILGMQQQQHIATCLNQLSDIQRECITLVSVEGYSLAEVAILQECPENTIKTRMFHARISLKRCLEKIKDLR